MEVNREPVRVSDRVVESSAARPGPLQSACVGKMCGHRPILGELALKVIPKRKQKPWSDGKIELAASPPAACRRCRHECRFPTVYRHRSRRDIGGSTSVSVTVDQRLACIFLEILPAAARCSFCLSDRNCGNADVSLGHNGHRHAHFGFFISPSACT